MKNELASTKFITLLSGSKVAYLYMSDQNSKDNHV